LTQIGEPIKRAETKVSLTKNAGALGQQ